MAHGHIERPGDPSIPEQFESNDWRRVLAWLRHRAEWVVCRFAGRSIYYWVGKGPSPDAQHPELPDGMLGLIDFWLEAIIEIHEMYRPRDEVPPPQGDAPEGVGDGWWVRYAPRAPDFRQDISSSTLSCLEPHRLAGWWSAATGLTHSNPRGRAVAALSLDYHHSGPWMLFDRATPSAPVQIRCPAPDLRRTVSELVDLGGRVLESPSTEARVVDPEGNIAVLTPVDHEKFS